MLLTEVSARWMYALCRERPDTPAMSVRDDAVFTTQQETYSTFEQRCGTLARTHQVSTELWRAPANFVKKIGAVIVRSTERYWALLLVAGVTKETFR